MLNPVSENLIPPLWPYTDFTKLSSASEATQRDGITPTHFVKEIGQVLLSSFETIHCILIAFKEENYGEYGWSLKNLLLLEFNIYAGLEQFLKIRNAEITVFLSFLLETVVTTTKSQKIK